MKSRNETLKKFVMGLKGRKCNFLGKRNVKNYNFEK